jgi:excisionase family DNA binding protein
MIAADKEEGSRTVLTINEIAAENRVTDDSIIRLIKRGKLKGYKVGHLWRVYADSWDEYVQSTSTSNTEATA